MSVYGNSYARKHVVDEAFFDCIDTEAKAYWLGFISADGCVYGPELQIGLNPKDKGHLKKLARSMKSTYPVKMRTHKLGEKQHRTANLRISSVQLVAALGCLGVQPNKSKILKPCAQVPTQLLHHYWRGMVDGDGSFSWNKTISQWYISLDGTLEITSAFGDWVSSFLESETRPRKGHGCSNIRYGGTRRTQIVVRQLYKDATVWLDRKYARAQQILATPLIRYRRFRKAA